MSTPGDHLTPPEFPLRRKYRNPPGHLLPGAAAGWDELLVPRHDLHGSQCGETDSGYRCTAQPRHGGLLHIAYSVRGEVMHTWPLTGAQPGGAR